MLMLEDQTWMPGNRYEDFLLHYSHQPVVRMLPILANPAYCKNINNKLHLTAFSELRSEFCEPVLPRGRGGKPQLFASSAFWFLQINKYEVGLLSSERYYI